MAGCSMSLRRFTVPIKCGTTLAIGDFTSLRIPLRHRSSESLMRRRTGFCRRSPQGLLLTQWRRSERTIYLFPLVLRPRRCRPTRAPLCLDFRRTEVVLPFMPIKTKPAERMTTQASLPGRTSPVLPYRIDCFNVVLARRTKAAKLILGRQ